MTSRHAPTLVAAVAMLASGACGGGNDQTVLPTPVDVSETVAIGVLPAPLSDTPTLPAPPPPPTTAPPAITTTTVDVGPIEGPLAEYVSGNQLLMIGDALLATGAPRNDGLMCQALTLFGWDTEIDAEPGHDLGFVDEVLDARFEASDPPWDAVALMIGNELDGAEPAVAAGFAEALDGLIECIAPTPVVLFTLPVVEVGRAELNDIIKDRPASYLNVAVIDFAEIGGDAAEVVDDAGLALTDDGNKRLSVISAAALGKAPGGAEGECLPTDYTS